MNIEWNSKAVPNKKNRTLKLKVNYSSINASDSTITVLAGSDNNFLGDFSDIVLPNAKSTAYIDGNYNHVYSGSGGFVSRVNGSANHIYMQGESNVTINGDSNSVYNYNGTRSGFASNIVVNGGLNRIYDRVKDHTGPLNITLNNYHNSFEGENAYIYLNGTVFINSKSVDIEIATPDKGSIDIWIRLTDTISSFISVLRTGSSRYFGVYAQNKHDDMILLRGEIEYGKKDWSQKDGNFVSLMYQGNAVGKVLYDGYDKISVNGTWVT